MQEGLQSPGLGKKTLATIRVVHTKKPHTFPSKALQTCFGYTLSTWNNPKPDIGEIAANQMGSWVAHECKAILCGCTIASERFRQDFRDDTATE